MNNTGNTFLPAIYQFPRTVRIETTDGINNFGAFGQAIPDARIGVLNSGKNKLDDKPVLFGQHLPFSRMSTLSIEQNKAMWQLFELVGLTQQAGYEAYETRSRCLNLASTISEGLLTSHPFSSESLIKFTSYIDAFRKPGFIWQKQLENEAIFIIPQPPLFGIDLEEFMQSFRILFSNFYILSCAGDLTLGLFLLFFHQVISYEGNEAVNWNEVVQSIIARTGFQNYNYGW